MRQATRPGHAATRLVALVLLAASLLALAAVPGAGGLAAAAVVWIVAFGLLEWSAPRREAK